MSHFDSHTSVWLFGYGSLIFKADFAFLERRPASIRHWERRLWQGSHDHRGTQAAPGRVVTLIPAQDSVCAGVAYRISPDVFQWLDHREKNGYLRHVTDICFDDGQCAEGLTYIARTDNAAFLGPAPEPVIAAQIAAAHGPSGHNREYVTALAQALRAMGIHDPHVFGVEKHL